MRKLSWIALVCILSAGLASCGGGGGGGTSGDSTTCSLGLSVYADGNANGTGYAIAQGGPSTPAVARQLSNCTITSLQSARLSMCIQHTAPSELTAQLILPVTAPLVTTLTPNLSPSVEDRSFCDFNNGTIYTMSIPTSTLASLPSFNVLWNSTVTDTVQNSQSGFLVSWSLLLSGR